MVAVLFGVVESVYVTIPDYGYNWSLLENLYLDPSGWLHEIFALWIGVGLFVEWTFRSERKQIINSYLRREKKTKEV